MTHYLSELYTPKQAWLALDPAGRHRFFEAVGSGLADLSRVGVEPIAFGEVDAGTLRAAPHAYFAIWRFPDEAALDALVSGISASGWHDYFETINAAGRAVDLPGHLAQLTAAGS
ncbi:hypothetical protein BLJAPNOD_01252 [Ensifer sp. M14]|jgi:hypothetical protein|uniref:DUF6616 family protein n=1 Tax=Ensifer sp. M14 TaxID=2203782 RepID=UPI000E1E2275|nr:DUF6616 family protein [Ensifer sp. M14]RDL50135.1 hypothetical protein BLJAPNOD_01252 [Ensifer sp. M14]